MSRLLLKLAALSIPLIIFATIWFFNSCHRAGLDDSLCKCKHSDHGGKPRIVNGSDFTDPHGLSWVVSVCIKVPENVTRAHRDEMPEGLDINLIIF